VQDTRSRRRSEDHPDPPAADRNQPTSGPGADTGARPRPERLRRSEDFRLTLRRGRRARHPLLHVIARRNQHTAPRVGLSVGKRVGGAVVRNWIKRRLRMIVQQLPWRTDAGHHADVVIVAQPDAASATFQEMYAATEDCTRRLALLSTENA
jgi:ribonuclease P protein component